MGFKKSTGSLRLITVVPTVDGFQFVVPEDECDQLGPSTHTERWRPLQAVVAQVQVFQLSQSLGESENKVKQDYCKLQNKQIKLRFYVTKC